MTTARQCFFIPVDAHVPGKGYVPSIVTEGEPGHAPLVGNGEHAEPWYWGQTYHEASQIAAVENHKLGLSHEDVAAIVLSSMNVRLH